MMATAMATSAMTDKPPEAPATRPLVPDRGSGVPSGTRFVPACGVATGITAGWADGDGLGSGEAETVGCGVVLTVEVSAPAFGDGETVVSGCGVVDTVGDLDGLGVWVDVGVGVVEAD